jgi:hypothetical protein
MRDVLGSLPASGHPAALIPDIGESCVVQVNSILTRMARPPRGTRSRS